MKPEEIDQFFSQKIAELDDVMPPTDWNPEATFHKIQNKMKPTRRFKILTPWYMSMAASVSFVALVSSSLYFNFSTSENNTSTLADIIEEKTEKSLNAPLYASDSWIDDENTPSIQPLEVAESLVSTSAISTVSTVRKQSIIPDDILEEILNLPKINTVKLPSIDVQAPETVASRMVTKKKKAIAFSQPFTKEGNLNEMADNALQMNLMAGAGYIANTVAPVVQLETRLLTSSQNQISKWSTYGGGLSIEGVMSKTEEGLEMRPLVFAEVSTGSLSKDEDKGIKGRGWSMGILLNPQEGTEMGRDTFRVRYTWELKNKIRISPELLVSDGFQKIYPGIRITKG